MIIRLCDTGSNFIEPITDPENTRFREFLLRWAAITRNLRIWQYAVTYDRYAGFPMPTVQTYAPNFQFYAEHNVEGIFTELEYPILADLRDFKVWMMMKLLEDPRRDYDALVRTFTDGFYGPAGGRMREYLEKLEAAAKAKPSYLSMDSSPRGARYLDLQFVREAQSIFDAAVSGVKDDPVLLRRVRHARLPLDRASVVLYPQLAQEWSRAGQPAERFPLNRDTIAARYKAAWYEQAELRLPEAETARAEAIERGLAWMAGMQGRDGGWAAFDRDNDCRILEHIPFADFMSPLDPACADVTAHIVELLSELERGGPMYDRALAYLARTQEADGAWYGRWGVNYVYGTGLVLTAVCSRGVGNAPPPLPRLEKGGEGALAQMIARAAAWLTAHQNPDGGWGETCQTYDDPALRGQGPSTPSQTAWALGGLIAAGQAGSPAVQAGVRYLLRSQAADGSWPEPAYTGTGFPRAFYLRYDLYRTYFPLLALARYKACLEREAT